MAVSDSYLDYLKDLLDWLPGLRVKRMFGGAGLYSDDLFFAIADDGALYLKADERNVDLYRAGGAEQFTAVMKGRLSRMNYWSVPGEVIEAPPTLRHWVELALESALRARR